MKPDCGGGKTLIAHIIEHDDLMTKYETTKFFEKNPDASFYEWVQFCKGGGYHGIPTAEHGLRRYKRQVKIEREKLKEENDLRSGNLVAFDLDKSFPYEEVSKTGERIFRRNWHYPNLCDCDLVTEKGAYRDEAYRIDDWTVYYYHQHAIAAIIGCRVVLDSCGYRTVTTKERMNCYINPLGYRVYSKDWVWYVDTGGNTVKFHDGMVLPVEWCIVDLKS